MIEVTYQMVLSTLQTAGILVGIVYYLTIMRNSQRTRELTLKAQEHTLETRQAQLFMQIYSLRHSTDYFLKYQEFLNSEWTDYDDYIEKFGDPETIAKTLSLGAYFEGIGVLVKRGLLDPTLVDDILRSNILMWWEKIEPLVKERRKRLNLPKSGEWSEYLYNELRRLERQHPKLKT
jgi:hypothetical protein